MKRVRLFVCCGGNSPACCYGFPRQVVQLNGLQSGDYLFTANAHCICLIKLSLFNGICVSSLSGCKALIWLLVGLFDLDLFVTTQFTNYHLNPQLTPRFFSFSVVPL